MSCDEVSDEGTTFERGNGSLAVNAPMSFEQFLSPGGGSAKRKLGSGVAKIRKISKMPKAVYSKDERRSPSEWRASNREQAVHSAHFPHVTN